jgi:hypothetical protein
LYHVLAAQQMVGRYSPASQVTGIVGSAYEEIAADLFATCAELLVAGELAKPTPNFTSVRLNGRSIGGTLTEDDIEFILDLLRNADDPSTGSIVGHVLMPAPVQQVFGDDSLISVTSEQGQQLLSLCRDISGDPSALEEWFDQLFAQ